MDPLFLILEYSVKLKLLSVVPDVSMYLLLMIMKQHYLYSSLF